ncbi:hypothetical protein L1987_66738 [Smallanthus sonchifolius]|uniref:Uncharacterized protein n=1 Tax=Smallanthus sonchifolius TaxID=185202 RepID=A0ACB9BXY2_9ASTR|nr:hypothetical protein L1987_66738 [Smallanthus sonchifolius]
MVVKGIVPEFATCIATNSNNPTTWNPPVILAFYIYHPYKPHIVSPIKQTQAFVRPSDSLSRPISSFKDKFQDYPVKSAFIPNLINQSPSNFHHF